MKVVILAGGFGTRLSEYTKDIPKPMVRIKGKPIIHYIMKHYAKYGFKDFIIAVGYKKKIIKKYFKKNLYKNFKVNVIDTGLNTMTGGRVKRLQGLLNNQRFFLTYGDGVSNVNIKKLLSFHKRGKKIATLTYVRPPARFGAIKINNNHVTYFKEKSRLDEGWINGGFFIFEPSIFKYIKNDKTFLEKEPLQNISKNKQLLGFKHNGFWQCMDTKRDKEILEKSFNRFK
ncbi:MAG: glucose-1-phosphate cytidylyltransferase [Candidatus Pelagibacter sp.]|nr:glucose-1-phosphate cytidylyltransferase [Candidatus Pelagibacter sp.]|tara:strand:+ start:39259 stop:39945 length:687 start_codon:yes stop_codon:yes gene_type:complete